MIVLVVVVVAGGSSVETGEGVKIKITEWWPWRSERAGKGGCGGTCAIKK